jgi:two-component system chemotaxis response regulator CheB
MKKPIRVLIADDSPFVCRLLTSYVQSTPDLQVVGTALSGSRAIEQITQLRPDVVTLDLDMADMSGMEALEHIMTECPVPVVLVSGVSREASDVTLRAFDLGAVDFVFKFVPGADTDPESLRRDITTKVRAASQIKVVRSLRTRRLRRSETVPNVSSAHTRGGSVVIEPLPESRRRGEALPFLPGGVVVIGASTGGPHALRELMSNLPADFPAAIIIIQHMPPTFTKVLAAQLDRQVPIHVKEAESGDFLRPGHALVAPGDYHLLLGSDSRVELNQGPEIAGNRPSVSVTMQSVARIYGARTRGVLLTGMGDDGSLGLVSIHAKGGKIYVQDAESCVVNGMPQRAIEKGVVDHIAPPAMIAHYLRANHSRILEE